MVNPFPVISSQMKSIIVGTAGHIDHGKTALVKALTGIDADRLEEEKRRGITIDLGFAHMDLPVSNRPAKRCGWALSTSPGTSALCATCWRAWAASIWCCW
jgi:translation initiation factor 2 gamma subunit (eIF-2gamma)